MPGLNRLSPLNKKIFLRELNLDFEDDFILNKPSIPDLSVSLFHFFF